MPGKTKIEWCWVTDSNGLPFIGESLNPVTGCDKVSPGCQFCYAEALAERFRGVPNHPYEQGFDLRLWPERLDYPLKQKKPRAYFVNSMSDWCHEDIPLDFVQDMFTMMCRAHWHIYQLLTKRANRMLQMVPDLLDTIEEETGTRQWPEHIWAGVTCESFAQRGRTNHLRRAKEQAGIHGTFVSYEPALGSPIGINFSGISWVIGGAESGYGARPMEIGWMKHLGDLCQLYDCRFFFKQAATADGKKMSTPQLDGRQWIELPAFTMKNSYHAVESVYQQTISRVEA
jgi:protein gp37